MELIESPDLLQKAVDTTVETKGVRSAESIPAESTKSPTPLKPLAF